MEKRIERYDINNKFMDYAVRCKSCGNVINLIEFSSLFIGTSPIDLEIPGIVGLVTHKFYPIQILKYCCECCYKPDYSFFEKEHGWIMFYY